VYLAPTNGQTLNPYSYVMNNPLSLTDPSGYVPTDCGEKNECSTDTGTHIPGHDTGIKGEDAKNLKTQQAITGAMKALGSLGLSLGTVGGQWAALGKGVAIVANNGQENQSQGAGSTLATSQGQGAGTGNTATQQSATANHLSGLQSTGQVNFVLPDFGADAAQSWADAASQENNPILATADNFMGGLATLGSNDHIVATVTTLASAGTGSLLNTVVSGIRQAYVNAVANLGKTAEDMRASGESEETIARTMVTGRNNLKDYFRGPLKGPLQGWHQPTFEQLTAGGKSIEQIQQSSLRTNSTWNALLGATPP